MKMSSRKSIGIRAAKRFDEFLKRAALERIKAGADKKFRNDPELTDMMLNCPSFRKVAEELTRLPKREDQK